MTIAVLSCMLLLAGCGEGTSKGEYEDGLAKLQGQLAEANEASRASGETTDATKRRAALADAHEALDAAADTAEGLDPPDDAKDAHDKLASALRDYATLFDRLAKLEENDPSESELYSEAGTIVTRLDTANRALEKAGYQVDQDDS